MQVTKHSVFKTCRTQDGLSRVDKPAGSKFEAYSKQESLSGVATSAGGKAEKRILKRQAWDARQLEQTSRISGILSSKQVGV